MKTIAIIGAGNMGGAIARGLTQSKEVGHITVSDISQAALDALAGFNSNITVTTNKVEAVQGADLVILAVKPWLIQTIVDEIKDHLDYSKQLLVSIAAGVSLNDLCAFLDKNGQLPVLFRLIPNTAIDVLQSVNTIAAHSNATQADKDLVCTLFNGMGKTFLVPEDQLNALMSLSSCGIAYAFRYIRAAVEGGVEMGIYPQVAQQVVLQTLRGAIELMEANQSHPEVEIDKVTTPGGITIKGLNEMEANGFTNAVIKGLKASKL